MATFLLEIRTEEIPATALPGARDQLEQLFSQHLSGSGYEGFETAALSTTRRLVVMVRNLPDRQADRTEDLTGPPLTVAVDADGQPTPAGEGFARKVGRPFDMLDRLETDRGVYLAATVVYRGRTTGEILAEVVPSVIGALHFPKMMRWGDGTHEFARPVHGVLALLDGDVVPLTLFGLEAGRSTLGHPVHSPESFDVQSAETYVEAMSKRSVVVDPEERRRRLEDLSRTLASEAGARVHPDPELMAEHVELVEWPGLIAGSFDRGFLELPSEVVVTTLRHHQKCLVLEDSEGNLEPGFIAVLDRRDDPEGFVSQGNEWVIGARLADASFFFAEDRKRPLEDLVPALARVEFHRLLGTLEDKASRVGELAVYLADAVGENVDGDVLRSAARLAKADLLTHMIGEFPELQGVMGGHYLRLEGASDGLWTAVRDHYRPVGFEGEVPASVIGQLLGVADRLDTVAGLFAVGERPSGSKDPFGLRRAAQGAVKIVATVGWDVDLESVLLAASTAVADRSADSSDEIAAAVGDFVADRVRRWLVDVVGVAADTAEAVMAAGWSRLPDAIARVEALERVREGDSFRSLALAFKRVRNITEGQPDTKVDAALVERPEERELFEATGKFKGDLDRLLPERRVEEAFAAMEPLADILERFFVEVLVMCEDERLRNNRIALLKELGRHFMGLADLSKLQVEGGEQ